MPALEAFFVQLRDLARAAKRANQQPKCAPHKNFHAANILA
jgi:hypothetical protein